MPPGGKGTKLDAKWQLNAALLSRPVDLSALVSLSRQHPLEFFKDDTLHRMVKTLLNETNEKKSDKDTKLDVLTILGSLASVEKDEVRDEIKVALGGVSEWFDEYIKTEEGNTDGEYTAGRDPELHKAMLLLLARVYGYDLRTADLLELCRGDLILGLEIVVGLLEDGETYTTELHQKQAPTAGKVAQWEHKLVCHRYERPMILQLCRMLRGFTHCGAYFKVGDLDADEHQVDEFTDAMNRMLDVTMKSRVIEKLSMALHETLFSDALDAEHGDDDGAAARGRPLSVMEDIDHEAVKALHEFVQNLYFYADANTEMYRQHLLADTLLIPRLVLPYLDRCVQHAMVLNTRSDTYKRALSMHAGGAAEPNDSLTRQAANSVADLALDSPALVMGLSASLRTLVIASFRAPPTRFMLALLRQLNPTFSILRASSFISRHWKLFAQLCLLNVNMGALDQAAANSGPSANASLAEAALHDTMPSPEDLLDCLSVVYALMPDKTKARVLFAVSSPGTLPVSRDTPSFSAVLAMLERGAPAPEAASPSARAGGALPIGVAAAEAKGASEEVSAWGEARVGAKADSQARLKVLSPDAKPTRREAEAEAGSKGDDAKEEAKAAAPPKYPLLGNLPSLEKARAAPGAKAAVGMVLELPGQRAKKWREPWVDPKQGGVPERSAAEAKATRRSGGGAAGAKGGGGGGGGGGGDEGGATSSTSAPKEFRCAINGHVMKHPVASPHGHVFERATIELWLSRNGSVCPLSGEPLVAADLAADDKLRRKIKLWRIKLADASRAAEAAASPSKAAAADDDDDAELYDF